MAALIAALSCAWSAPAEAAAGAPPTRWEKLRAQDLRVAEVGYRLATANAHFCRTSPMPQAGLVLHSLEQYDPVDRHAAARSFSLGSEVGVMGVVPGSPAQLAGVAADDQLVSVNGRLLSSATALKQVAPTRAPVEFAQRVLVEEMAKGEVVLRVSRAGDHHDVRFTAERGCASPVELAPGGEINAWADGQRVVVGDGIVARCRTDGELALVIGHELAHNLLRHSKQVGLGGSESPRLRLTGTGSAAMRKTEEDADRLAVRMAIAAGYDMSNALSFLTALLDSDRVRTATDTHPAAARRLTLLKAEIAAADTARAPRR